MADPNLAAYIRQSLDSGYSEADIRNALLGEGWDEASVNDAFSEVYSQAAAPIEPPITPVQEIPVQLQQVQQAQPGGEAVGPTGQETNLQVSESKTIRIVAIAGISLSLILIIGGIIDILFVQYPAVLDENMRLLNESVDISELDESNVTLIGVLDFMSFVPIILGVMGIIMFVSILFNTKKLLLLTVMAVGIISIVVGVMQDNFIMPIVWIVVIGLLLLNRKLLTD
jgi:hypothetical protein